MNPSPQAVEITMIDTLTAVCDGAGANLPKGMGHPKVFLPLKNGRVRCPYCGRRFVRRRGSASTETVRS